MSILNQLIIYTLLSILLFGFSYAFFTNKNSKINKYISIIFFETALWNICIVIMTLLPDNNIKFFFYNTQYLFITTLPIFILLAVFIFFKIDDLLSKEIIVWLSIPPIIYTVLIYTNNFHHFFIKSSEIIKVDNFNIISSHYDIIYYLTYSYSYLLLGICSIATIVNLLNVPKVFRKQIYLVITSITIPAIINALYLFVNPSITFLNLPCFLANITLIIFFLSDKLLNLTSLNPISRTYIIKANNTPIIVLNENNIIIDMNSAAERIFYNTLDSFFGKSVSILDNYIQKTTITNDHTKIYLDSNIYRVTDSMIFNRKGQKIGIFKSYYDITKEENYLNELKYISNHDTLTGLYNRAHYNSVISSMQTEKHLPLGLILGDLNYLKIVNDTFGHKQGDNIIKLAAQTILLNVGSKDLVFRIGGDEFLILLPNTDEASVKSIINNINDNFMHLKNLNTSISFGYSIMRNKNDSFNHSFSKADANMYLEKARIKINKNL